MAKAYGITLDQYLDKVRAQHGRCAICGEKPTATGKAGRLYVDHDHAAGDVRDLLCHWCNAAIGSLREDPALCRAAAAYLERWGKRCRAA